MESTRLKAFRKPIPLYLSEEEQQGLRTASQFNAALLDFLRTKVFPGQTTLKLDQLAHEFTIDHGHIPACLGYHGYPNTICTSVNEVVCHGIPNERPLREGDIVNVDATTIVDGWFGDQSEMFMVGEVSVSAKRLVQTTFDAMWVGIRACRTNGTVTDIGRAIQQFVQKAGFAVVREYQGHGIGREFHQEPGVPHFPSLTSNRDVLRPGTCFTIEPMLNVGTWKTKLNKKDGWTVRTQDGSLSAQFEHQILMTDSGPEILTVTKNGPQEGHKF
jgi:methionyl aminopeptidase